MPPDDIGTEGSATQTVTQTVVEGVSRVNPDGTSSPILKTEDSGHQPPGESAVGRTPDDQDRTSGLDDKSLEGLFDRISGKPVKDPVTGQFKSPNEQGQTETETTQTEAGTQSQQTQQTAADMPKSWPAEKKGVWDKIADPEARAFITERETKAHSIISQQGQALSRFKPMGDLIVKNRDVFERHNANPVQAFGRLLAVQRKLDESPEKTISAIAEAYGVDLRKLVGVESSQTTQVAGGKATEERTEVQIPAEVAAILEEVRETALETAKRLDQRELSEQQQRELAEAREDATTRAEVEQWRQDKPHYEQVKRVMSMLILSGEADTLDDAYAMACAAKPEIRKLVEAEQKKAAEAETQRTETQKVAAAKRASSIQVGGAGPQRPKGASNGKWDSDNALSDRYERIVSKA